MMFSVEKTRFISGMVLVFCGMVFLTCGKTMSLVWLGFFLLFATGFFLIIRDETRFKELNMWSNAVKRIRRLLKRHSSHTLLSIHDDLVYILPVHYLTDYTAVEGVILFFFTGFICLPFLLLTFLPNETVQIIPPALFSGLIDPLLILCYMILIVVGVRYVLNPYPPLRIIQGNEYEYNLRFGDCRSVPKDVNINTIEER